MPADTMITSQINTADFAAYVDTTHRAVEAAQQRALEDAARLMVDTVAVDTGATRDSIRVEGDTVIAGGAALYLEFGTVRMGAQPFMIPAFHTVVDRLETYLRRAMADGHGGD